HRGTALSLAVPLCLCVESARLLDGDEGSAAAGRAARGRDDDGGRAARAVGDCDVDLFEAKKAAGLSCVADLRCLAADLHGDGQGVAPARAEQRDLRGLVIKARGERTRRVPPTGDEERNRLARA